MSKTYLNRKDPQGSYVFISYSHKDEVEVDRILTALNACGADFWYDIELRHGVDWHKKVKEVTASQKCVGILYFISANSIKSDACHEEFEMLDDLKKTHEKFGAMYIIIDDEEHNSLETFFDNADSALKEMGLDRKTRLEKISKISDNFDKGKKYRIVSRDKIDEDETVNVIFKDVFCAWGCASEELGKIDALMNDGLVDADYRLKTPCRISVDRVSGRDAEWKVFSYNGDTLSAILLSDELYSATCLSLAKEAMATINENVNSPSGQNVKHFTFDEEFLQCLKKDKDGNVIRYLRASEHENNYLQLEKALKMVPVLDSVDDGYFFVQDSRGELLFADRGSSDVYRHIHVDAYASIIPVIDVDYEKYNAYFLRRDSGKA